MRRLALTLVASLLLVGACGGSGKDKVAGSSTTSTTSAGGGTTSATGPTGPATTLAPGRGAKSQPGQGVPIAQAPSDKLAPKDGDYKYAGTTTDSKGEQSQEIQILRVSTTSRSAVVRQTHRLGNSRGDAVKTVEWRPDGLWVLDQHSERGGDSSSSCDWQPDSLDWPLPFRVGGSWSSDSTCRVGDTTQKLTIDGKVTGTETIDIAGQKVRAVVLERTNTTHIVLGGSVPLDRVEKVKEWVSPELGLLLRSHKTVSSAGAVALGGSVDLTLQNLSPK